MKKTVIRCVEAKVFAELKKYRGHYTSVAGSSYVYYGFKNCKDDSQEHINALRRVVEAEVSRIGWGAPTTIPMTVCKIKPQQSKKHAHMTMIKVMVPNNQIVGYFIRRHIEL